MIGQSNERYVTVNGARIFMTIAGEGPAILLLHGYPQTHRAWKRLVPRLARHFTVITPDLPGYGRSQGPSQSDSIAAFSKRAVAATLVGAVRALSIERFAVIGHDRGARVAYRMALDHPKQVRALASLTVVPTIEAFEQVDASFSLNAYHWFMLAQPFDLPERMIGADPDYFLDATLSRMTAGKPIIDQDSLNDYRASFRKPSVRHGICQDYRCAATIDREHDLSDRNLGTKISCPTLVLWSAKNRAAQQDSKMLEIWRRWADQVEGVGILAGHLLPEEASEEVLHSLEPFLLRNAGEDNGV
jgi:haloacetate dehalogenase